MTDPSPEPSPERSPEQPSLDLSPDAAPEAPPSVIAVIGAGWRAEYILRVALALPERFEVAGIVARDPAKAEPMARRHGVALFASLAQLLAHRRPDFAVLSIKPHGAPEWITELLARDVPVITETPPAASLDDLTALYRAVGSQAPVQVAEQYHLQPLTAAQLALAASGVLGTVRECRVSLSHGYHAMSVLRRMLGTGFTDATITASRFDSPLVAGPGRAGDPRAEEIVTAELTIAHLSFGERYGVYDWAPAQNRSWIRRRGLLARGERGEIDGLDVRYLADIRTPVEYRIQRVEAGQYTDLQGHFLRGLLGGQEWLYRNEFAPAPLMDDEIAVASCLARMARFVRGGPGFYGLAEASQDHYLAMAVHDAAESGQPVRTSQQVWASAP